MGGDLQTKQSADVIDSDYKDAGVTKERRKLNVEFWSDVFPYYLPCYVFVVTHLMYYSCGNLLMPIWMAYTINLPLCWKCRRRPETNLDPESEMRFKRD